MAIPFGLDRQPFLGLVGWDVVDVTGDFVGCEGIRTSRSEFAGELIIFVCNSPLRCNSAHGVDRVINRDALSGISRAAIGLIEILDLIQIGFFLCIIERAKFVGALEEEMFEVMREAGRIRRIVLAAGTDGNHRLNARLRLVDTEIDRQPVLQRVNASAERIARDGHVLVPAGGMLFRLGLRG